MLFSAESIIYVELCAVWTVVVAYRRLVLSHRSWYNEPFHSTLQLKDHSCASSVLDLSEEVDICEFLHLVDVHCLNHLFVVE